MIPTDENAFGLLFELYGIEDLQYSLEPDQFVERFTRFRDLLLEEASRNSLGEDSALLDLGHALYFEIGDGDQSMDPLDWLGRLCLPLVREPFELCAILTHGGRWIDPSGHSVPRLEPLEGGYRAIRAAFPSEPLQRALCAAAFCHGPSGSDGWGTGLFVDSEAALALGKRPKNAPTPLLAGGATFYRLSLPE